MRLAQMKGELAPIGEVNAHIAGMIIRAREILIRMSAELKDRLAQLSDPHQCAQLITGEMERALNELREFQREPR